MELNLKDLTKTLEDNIEKNFGTHPGYLQIKSFLEGKAGKVDGRTLVTDAHAVFTGDNKPEMLVSRVFGGMQNKIETRVSVLHQVIDQNKLNISQELEKKQAIIENRPANITHTAGPQEAVLTGRLMNETGQKPLAGAEVVLSAKVGTVQKVISRTVTDDNGEYIIRLDQTLTKEAPKSLSLAFETTGREQFAKSLPITLSKVMGKVEVHNIQAAGDKSKLVVDMVKNAEDRKPQAMIQIGELKRTEGELDLLRFQIQQSTETLKGQIGNLKSIFDGTSPSG
jgi:hypothetical protein